jgi:hypothetical protein
MNAVSEGVSDVRGACKAFPVVENEEFFIRERLGRHAIRNPEIATIEYTRSLARAAPPADCRGRRANIRPFNGTDRDHSRAAVDGCG